MRVSRPAPNPQSWVTVTLDDSDTGVTDGVAATGRDQPTVSLQQVTSDIPLDRSTLTVFGLAVTLVLIGLSGFFSSREVAMFSLARHRVDAMVEEEIPGGEQIRVLKRDPHPLLVTILVWNNLVNIAISSIATGLLALYLGQGQAVIVATFGITVLVLLFGESALKSYAVENTESWALRFARPLMLSECLLLPLVVVFDYLTPAINRITGGRSAIESTYVTRDEIEPDHT